MLNFRVLEKIFQKQVDICKPAVYSIGRFTKVNMGVNMVKLADAEWNIMELLWDKGPLTTMEIIRELENSIGWNKSTTMTLLRRMNDKGSIHFENDNKTKKYYPNFGRDEAELEEAKFFLNKHYKGKIGIMVSNLINQEALSKEEIEELYDILREGK